MLYKRYISSFISVAGVQWRIEIFQEAEEAFVVAEVDLAASPLEIEWNELEKHAVVMSSAATLKLICNTDREFVDLYHVVPGSVRLDVYREDDLYWRGTMNTELYEEPYSYLDGYEVTLTFSDMAILERLLYETKDEILSLGECASQCLEASTLDLDIVKHISTLRDTYSVWEKDFVQSANFYDEEGIAMSYREVLEGVLQPYGLHVSQRAGKWYIWDWNALKSLSTNVVVWDGTNANLSVGKTYNRVNVNYSPYQSLEVLSGDIPTTTEDESVSVREDYGYGGEYRYNSVIGFNVVIFEDGDNDIVDISEGNKIVEIEPVYMAERANAIAYVFNSYLLVNGEAKVPTSYAKDASHTLGGRCFKAIQEPFISPDKGNNTPDGYYRGDYDNKLKITLEALIDVRYNPFGESSTSNNKTEFDKLKDWANYVYVPVKIELKNADGEVLYHIDNSKIIDTDYSNHSDYSFATPEWVAGAGSWGDAVLCYYDKDNLESSTGVGGWKSNSLGLGLYTLGLPATYKYQDSGEFLPMPPVAGYLSIEIGEGLLLWDEDRVNREELLNNLKFVWYKYPSITIVDSTGTELETVDLGYDTWINEAAADSIDIDTIVGSLYACSARGQILNYDESDNTYTRDISSSLLEELLCNDIYTQYNDIHFVLSGDARIVPTFGVLTEANTDGDFFITAEVQDLINDISNITLTQIL